MLWRTVVFWAVTSSVLVAIAEPAMTELRDEQDLIAEQLHGSLAPANFDAALEVLREGIDLPTTSREELGNVPGLTDTDIEALLAHRESLTDRQRALIGPFLRGDQPFSGRARLLTQITTTDTVAPPLLLAARAQGPYSLSAGLLIVTTRRVLAAPRVVDGAFVTSGFGYSPQLPRVYLQWHDAHARLIAGTFTVGFAERLTLDTTRRVTPQGFALSEDFRHPIDLSRTCRLSSADAQTPCAEGRNLYVTPDFDVREVFRGVAASLENVSLGSQRLGSVYGFLSYQARSAYQYELVDRRTCADPSRGCTAPYVYLEGSQTRVIFSTLPALYDELTGGAHAQLCLSEGLELGVTGYAAAPRFHDTGSLDVSFQPWSRHPATGPYGALGVDARARVGELGLHLEATRSLNQNHDGGGGFGVVERSTWRSIELSLRYYDSGFTNPNARPVSAPDEYDGQRARDELGARLTASTQLAPRWALSGRADLWVLPFANARVGPAGMANLFALARIDFAATPWVQPGISLETRNRNLASSHHGRCASGTVIATEGEPFDCSGDLYRIAARLRVALGRTTSIISQSLLTFTDDRKYSDRFRVDFQQWFEARGQPVEWLQWRLRTRYLNQAVDDNAYLEHSLWSFLELAWVPRSASARIALRYDAYVWLDSRAVTLSRTPSPEHRLSLDARTTF